MRLAYALAAAVAASLFVRLGFDVTLHGEPQAFAAMERAVFDHGTLVAWWLTWACYLQVLAPIAVVLLVLAWSLPAWRGRIIFSIVMLLLCWRGADFFQHYFMRPRPTDWVVKQEMTFAYPSSHATIAFGFYLLWAAMLFASDLPRGPRTLAAAFLTILVVAICWARLALGAHYFTDLVGGGLLALTLVAAGLAIVPVKVFAPGEVRA